MNKISPILLLFFYMTSTSILCSEDPRRLLSINSHEQPDGDYASVENDPQDFNQAHDQETSNCKKIFGACCSIGLIAGALATVSALLRKPAVQPPAIDWAHCLPHNASYLPATPFGVSIKDCGACPQVDSTFDSDPYCGAPTQNYTEFMAQVEKTVGPTCGPQASYCVAPDGLAQNNTCQSSSQLDALEKKAKECTPFKAHHKSTRAPRNSLTMHELRKQVHRQKTSKLLGKKAQ